MGGLQEIVCFCSPFMASTGTRVLQDWSKIDPTAHLLHDIMENNAFMYEQGAVATRLMSC
jgi:hypothetical protein